MSAEIDLRSSSNDLSSAPTSDTESAVPPRPSSSHPPSTIYVSPHPSSSIHQSPYGPLPAPANPSATRQAPASVKVPKPRKKKEIDPNAPPKEKKPRKPRASTSTTDKVTKKRKTNEDGTGVTTQFAASHPADLSASKLVQPATFASSAPLPYSNEAAKTSQWGFLDHPSKMNPHPPSPTTPRLQHHSAAPNTTTVTNIFDPVRGVTRTTSHTPASIHNVRQETPPRPTTAYQPSTSPAIASLIHPHNAQDVQYSRSIYTTAKLEHTPQPMSTRLVNTSEPRTVIDLDQEPEKPRAITTTTIATPPEKVVHEAEVKPKRAKEQPAPPPIGSGLLGQHFFGGGDSEQKDQSEKGSSIFLQVKLGEPGSNVINFARLAEEKYGFAALYPRQAAQRKRMAEVAAQGALLEKNGNLGKKNGTAAESADEDLSVDIDRDSDNEGDVTMGGINGTNENSGTEAGGPKRRRRKVDDYDADDPFVDDSEMVWEAQAAVSKDGFFVYMGPLVAEGEKANIERAEGATKRGRGGGGRGRGGGPGSRGGRGAAKASANAHGKESTASGSTRGGGGGSKRGSRQAKTDRAHPDKSKAAGPTATALALPA